jgi:hypothetical protein
VLLGVSGAGELFGTVTVWRNYVAGSSLASQIQRDIGVEVALERRMTDEDFERQISMGIDPSLPISFGEVGASLMLRDLRGQFANQLTSTR